MTPKPYIMTPEQVLPVEDPPLDPAVIVVTPYSSGCCIAKEIQDRGYKLICLWSSGFSDDMKTHIPKSVTGIQWDLVLDEEESLDRTVSTVLQQAAGHGLEIVSCLCGGEAGVDLADSLSEKLGLLSNGTSIKNRRDKKVQQDLIKAAGLRSTRQVSGRSYTPEVESFLKSEAYPVILKPLDSAGSDGVKLCHSMEEAKNHFLYLLNEHDMVNGGKCDEVLCQEFLKGTEYVVDQVSRDGIHKTVMLWRYDKRAVNGASFVYFGDVPVDSDSSEAKLLIPYARAVLDALGCVHGPSHAEVIITDDGPCLVEMNCRAHGGDGIWQSLCEGLTGGYSQIDATVDAYLDEDRFKKLPNKPPSPFKAAGQCVDLVCYKSGLVEATPGYDVIRLLPSFLYLESHIGKGVKVTPTVDLATQAGSLVMMHQNKEILARDIALIRQIESSHALFQLQPNSSEDGEAVHVEVPCDVTATKVNKKTKPRSCSFDNSGTAALASTPSAAFHHRRLVSNDNPALFMQSKHI